MGKIGLLIILVLGLGTFFLTSQSFKQHEQQNSQANQHRSTWIDDTGKLHTMGLVLGESTVRDAELILRSRSDAAIFMYPESKQGNEQRFRLELEAYFPSIADHSKIMLVLNIKAEELEQIRQRGTSPRIYPNGVARVNLANEDTLSIKQFTFNELRLVPSVQLDASMLEARFGKPQSVQRNNDGSVRYLYPKLGLKALINPDAKDVLSFSSAK
ncbi:MAG: hypothetical protein JKY87_04680 [Mariprofundus sp.]|nr:hypothetical protein [Mariprofundus sp.]